MKSKGVAICVMIAVGCAAGLLIHGYLTSRAAAQSRAEPIRVQWEKIGVMPFFKGRRSAETGESLTCPLCELTFISENIKGDAERALTGYVQRALELNAAAVLFAHNHPSGVAEPSMADQRITERLKSALALIDVRVLDHFIVTAEDSISFAERSLL